MQGLAAASYGNIPDRLSARPTRSNVELVIAEALLKKEGVLSRGNTERLEFSGEAGNLGSVLL